MPQTMLIRGKLSIFSFKVFSEVKKLETVDLLRANILSGHDSGRKIQILNNRNHYHLLRNIYTKSRVGFFIRRCLSHGAVAQSAVRVSKGPGSIQL